MGLRPDSRDSRFEIRDSFGSSRIAHHASRITAGAILALVLSGCSNFEPWVKPYERAALADPIMAASRNPIADDFMLHVYEVREGARGAAGSAGGGCGCN